MDEPLQTCPQCHYLVRGDARWCPFCGWAPPPQLVVYQVPVALPAPPPHVQRIEVRERKPFVGPISGCLLLGILVLVFFAIVGAIRR